MNIEKIEIKPNKYVWVDYSQQARHDIGDDVFNEGAYYHVDPIKNKHIITKDTFKPNPRFCFKIIAASTELNLDLPTYVEWLAEKEYEEQSSSFEDSTEMFPFDDSALLKIGFIKGYQTAEKELFTEEDFKLFARMYYREIKLDKSNLLWDDLADKCFEQFKQEKK